jgi:hypothetical protein
MPRRVTTTIVALLLSVAALLGAVPAPAGAQDATTTTVVEGGDIIPEPNSGREPEDAGDRGGALQSVLFAALVVAVAGAAFVLVRQSRRARAGRGF